MGKRFLIPVGWGVHYKPTPFVESVGYSFAVRFAIKYRSAQDITATAALVMDPCVVLVVIVQSDRNGNLAAGPSAFRAAFTAKEDTRNKSVVLFEGVQSVVVQIVKGKWPLEMIVDASKQLRI